VNTVGWVGLFVFLGCLGLIALELAFIAFRLSRARRSWLRLQAILTSEGGPILEQLERMERLSAENRFLLLPYRRLLQRLQSPTVVALWQAYRARRERN